MYGRAGNTLLKLVQDGLKILLHLVLKEHWYEIEQGYNQTCIWLDLETVYIKNEAIFLKQLFKVFLKEVGLKNVDLTVKT